MVTELLGQGLSRQAPTELWGSLRKDAEERPALPHQAQQLAQQQDAELRAVPWEARGLHRRPKWV